MEPTDVTIEILRDIRDEIRQTNSRIDGTNERVESLREELSRLIVESEIRTSTAIAALARTVSYMTEVLRASPRA